MSEDASVERLSVVEAARVLGVTRDAIHKRISRGSIEYEKVDGRFYVYVDTSTLGLDLSTDTSKDESKVEASVFVEELRDRLHYVERQLEAERQAHSEARRIIAGLVERLPPAIEPPGGSTEATEEPERAGERPEERSWWRRMFGG